MKNVLINFISSQKQIEPYIVDSKGNLVAKYEYTAYGEITSITGSLSGTIGQYNPLKRYYYDRETGLYLIT